MNKLLGLALIAAPFVGFGLMMGEQMHLGAIGVFIAAIGAAGFIIVGAEVLDAE